MVVFGGSCPSCLTTGIRIPLTAAVLCTAPCQLFWMRSCKTAPLPTCTNVFFPTPCPFPPDPRCPNNDLCSFVTGNEQLTSPQVLLDCTPVLKPPQNSYRLRITFRCDFSFVGGELVSDSSSVQCDPFQITFTNFTQTVGSGLGGQCAGVPCGSNPPSSIIIIPHV